MNEIEQEAQEILNDEDARQVIIDAVNNGDDIEDVYTTLYHLGFIDGDSIQFVKNIEQRHSSYFEEYCKEANTEINKDQQAIARAMEMYKENPDAYVELSGDSLDSADDWDANDLSEGVDGLDMGDSSDAEGDAEGSLGDMLGECVDKHGYITISESKMQQIVINVAKRLMKEGSMENLKDSDWNIEDHKRATMKRVGTKKDGTPKMGSKKKSDAKKAIIKKQTNSAIKNSRKCVTNGSLENCATDGGKADEKLQESIYNIKKLMLG